MRVGGTKGSKNMNYVTIQMIIFFLMLVIQPIKLASTSLNSFGMATTLSISPTISNNSFNFHLNNNNNNLQEIYNISLLFALPSYIFCYSCLLVN
ncbi:uncharacterized protein DS421_2g38410 [Arachis hypogaea]|nr:uncharacterized protein DS421_2g38410 [Arachis hypogaea]